MVTISTFLLNKRVPATWVLTKDRKSCNRELESRKITCKWHFTIKNGLKTPILAILGIKCKNKVTISTFLSNKRVPATWVLTKGRKSCYWELESRKITGKWYFIIKNGF